MDQHTFEIEVSNDAGDVERIHVSEDMSPIALVERAVHKLFPQSTTPITQYSLSVNGELYSNGSWQVKTVKTLGIADGVTVMIFGPSPKG